MSDSKYMKNEKIYNEESHDASILPPPQLVSISYKRQIKYLSSSSPLNWVELIPFHLSRSRQTSIDDPPCRDARCIECIEPARINTS